MEARRRLDQRLYKRQLESSDELLDGDGLHCRRTGNSGQHTDLGVGLSRRCRAVPIRLRILHSVGLVVAQAQIEYNGARNVV